MKGKQQKYHPGRDVEGECRAERGGAGRAVKREQGGHWRAASSVTTFPHQQCILIQTCKVSCLKKKKEEEKNVHIRFKASYKLYDTPRLVTYLNLSVVANGFDGRGVSQDRVCAAWTELDHSLGPAHQAGHSAAVFNQLLLLLLREISRHERSIQDGASQITITATDPSLSKVQKTYTLRLKLIYLSIHAKYFE